MGWIKRNLFFAIGGALALVLLLGAAYYIYQGWSNNAAAAIKLGENYDAFQQLIKETPGPGNKTINNTALAREQEMQAIKWMDRARAFFQPVPAIPAETPVTSEAFATALRRSLDQLRHAAEDAGVTLPPKYDFSFTAQSSLMKFARAGLPSLAEQLGEVKVISEILFAARINALDGLQRARVSMEDFTGPPSDYLDALPVTNHLAVVTPYVVTFSCFSPELARVLVGFATAPNAFIVQNVNLQPAAPAVPVGGLPPGFSPAGLPPPPLAAPPLAGRGGLPVVLKEQLLRVTLELKLVKLPAKN